MPTKSLELTVPDTPPYDQAETWFESFIGNHIAPLVQSAPLKRFWFSRYGAIGSKKWILFRFECDDITVVQPHIDNLMRQFPVGTTGYVDYDHSSDIGEGEGSRFLGENGRHHDKQKRGDLAFNFLHASALLFLDGLRGPDGNSRFEREPETASRFSHETSLEQFLHLFCNMTGAPSFVVEATHPKYGNLILSEINFGNASQTDPRWKIIRVARVKF